MSGEGDSRLAARGRMGQPRRLGWCAVRRSGLAVVVLALGAGVVFLHPAVYCLLTGWVKGKAFYQGRPTSYWSGVVQEWYEETDHLELRMNWGDALPPRRATTTDRLTEWLG